jgi:aerobic carbon-monoxide dehydrogenase medium subunit
MYPAEFEYFRARTVAEASRLLRKHKGSRLLAGGHSLLPAMKLRLSEPAALIDLGGLRGLAAIRAKGKSLVIGAMTTHAAVASSPIVAKSCPLLAETASQIGDVQVRNRGTIGGSLAHADPAADYPTAILALDATLVVQGARGQRKIPAVRFFLDLFTTALKPGEILTSVVVPAYAKGMGEAYLKHRHPASSYAVVGVAALVELSGGVCKKVSLAVGGAGGVPVRVSEAEAALAGSKPDAKAIEAAAAKVSAAIADPMSDTYASGEYRLHLATVLARRALTEAVARALSS